MKKSISEIKNNCLKLFYENKNIVDILNAKDIINPYDLLGTHLFPYIKFNFTSQDIGTYICIKIDYPNIAANEAHKILSLTVMVISNNEHIESDNKNRADLLSEEVTKVLHQKDDLGLKLELQSDIEDPLNENFYFRKLVFKSIVSNRDF